MDKQRLEALRATAQKGQPLDPRVVLDLIGAYEALHRAETFWSERAPAMNEELLILRQIEAPARAHAAHDPKNKHARAMAPVLAKLDELRAVGKGAE